MVLHVERTHLVPRNHQSGLSMGGPPFLDRLLNETGQKEGSGVGVNDVPEEVHQTSAGDEYRHHLCLELSRLGGMFGCAINIS